MSTTAPGDPRSLVPPDAGETTPPAHNGQPLVGNSPPPAARENAPPRIAPLADHQPLTVAPVPPVPPIPHDLSPDGQLPPAYPPAQAAPPQEQYAPAAPAAPYDAAPGPIAPGTAASPRPAYATPPYPTTHDTPMPYGAYPPPTGSVYAPPPGTYPPGAGSAWQFGGPTYFPAPQIDPAVIGPHRVPWRWYDVLGAGSLFVFIAVSAFLTPSSTMATGTQQTVSRSGMSRELFLIFNTVVNVIVYGLVLLLIWWRSLQAYRMPWSALGVRKAPWWQFALMVPVYIVMLVLAGLASQAVNELFYGGKGINPQIDAITGGGGFSWVALVCALISASVVAPIVEELFFRGMLYGWLRTKWAGVIGAIAAVTVDAAIFATAHGIGLILASIFIVGLTLAIVYERTKSTLVTITLHSLSNTVSVVSVFVTLATGGKLPGQ